MRLDRRSAFKQNSRRDTVLWGGSIYEAHPEGVSHVWKPDDPSYLLSSHGTHGMVMNVAKSQLSQLEECPECETPMVACEPGDYICCWCRDAT